MRRLAEVSMSRGTSRWLACGAAILCAIGSASVLRAQLEIGTWVRTDLPAGTKMSMTVQACCNGGRRLIYHVEGSGQPPMEMTIDSGLDGKDAAVLVGGKPSGQTMAITRVDALHVTSIQKMNGKIMSTSKGTLLGDGKTMTVENEIDAGGKPMKVTEKWVKQ
jgi:hypothetical protein